MLRLMSKQTFGARMFTYFTRIIYLTADPFQFQPYSQVLSFDCTTVSLNGAALNPVLTSLSGFALYLSAAAHLALREARTLARLLPGLAHYIGFASYLDPVHKEEYDERI